MKINKALKNCLDPAYPCIDFECACVEMHKNREICNMPRGFCGGTGSLEEVELVLVFSEPGDPYKGEKPNDFESAYENTMNSFRNSEGQFHKNVRKILYSCWPSLSSDDKFDQIMRKVWLTESVLCSAQIQGGYVPVGVSRACGCHYLSPQLLLFPNALIVALGSKPKNRLVDIGFCDFFPAGSAAPSGCNKHDAIESRNKIPLELQKHWQGLLHQS